MRKAIIFDFDGVIIDSSKVQKYAFNECYKMCFGKEKEVPIDEFFMHSGSSLEYIFTQMEIPLKIITTYRNISSEKIKDIEVVDGILPILQRLKEQNIPCGLCTGKDKNRTLEILEYFNLKQYFGAIVCSDEVKHPKPAPDSLWKILKELKVDSEHAVMIGDSVNDIACARDANVFSIAVTWGDQQGKILEDSCPDLLLSSVEQLENYIFRKINLMDDLVIKEDVCNLACDYCLTKTSVFKNNGKHKFQYKEGSVLKRDLDEILRTMCNNYDTAILKISGGEVLLIDHIIDFIIQYSKNYKVIQVLTNGLLLNETLIQQLSEINNICIQLSLDHHTIEGNVYRTKRPEQLEKILKNLDLLVKYHIPVEINCVLTNKNYLLLKSYAEYLMKYAGESVMLLPFPIRGCQKDVYIPGEKFYEGTESLLAEYDQFKEVLPPRVYLEGLHHVLKYGVRAGRCFIPKVANGLFDDGRRTPCPNYWFSEMENILEKKCGIELQEKYRNLYYKIINSKQAPRECRHCYTQWDIFNLFLEDKITLNELVQVPLFRFESIKSYLIELKQMNQGKSVNP